jgi:hypothetical protein
MLHLKFILVLWPPAFRAYVHRGRRQPLLSRSMAGFANCSAATSMLFSAGAAAEGTTTPAALLPSSVLILRLLVATGKPPQASSSSNPEDAAPRHWHRWHHCEPESLNRRQRWRYWHLSYHRQRRQPPAPPSNAVDHSAALELHPLQGIAEDRHCNRQHRYLTELLNTVSSIRFLFYHVGELGNTDMEIYRLGVL